ncbi:MAG: hypothetical protein J5I47_06115 [Vicingus serpentipes]|nr:hypothetical protein [Vicingus serpentipes]
MEEIITQIETSIAYFYIEDEILFMRSKKDADITLRATIESVNARRQLQNGKKMLMLVDTRDIWQVSSESRAYSTKKRVEDLTIAMALLPGSNMTTILIANFFIKFNKPSIPTKLFKTEDKAIEWLNSFK